MTFVKCFQWLNGRWRISHLQTLPKPGKIAYFDFLQPVPRETLHLTVRFMPLNWRLDMHRKHPPVARLRRHPFIKQIQHHLLGNVLEMANYFLP